MRNHRLLFATAAAALVLCAHPAAAQRGGYEGGIIWEEPEPEQTAPATTPAPAPAARPTLPTRKPKYTPPEKDPTAPLPARLVNDTLETFASEAAFRRYLRDVDDEEQKREGHWYYARRKSPVLVAQLQDPDAQQDAPCGTPEECPGDENMVVTGTRISKPQSITNTQEAGVDEGDIVKQIGRFLLVLQDGRIFAVDTGSKPGDLKLADRINVYRDPKDYIWYDEMLVQDDHVIVTAYSYSEDATEVSVFRLSPEGKLSSEGVFLISSDDYYDTSNYATRLVGDKLVIYQPLDLDDFDWEDEAFAWPLVRRWTPEAKRDEEMAKGKKLFDARTIYRPVQATLEPVVHTVSVCPIGPVRKGRDMQCRSTAVVGPQQREFYVSPTDAYLWVSPGGGEYETDNRWQPECDEWSRRGPAEAHPATLFRLPLSGDEPSALHVKGVPTDQFSFDARDGRFRGLVRWYPIRCDEKVKSSTDDDDDPKADFYLFDVSLSRLGYEPGEAPKSAYTPMPAIGQYIENRFTDRYLVYGNRDTRWSRPPDEDDEQKVHTARVAAVPLKAPRNNRVLDLPHNVIRLEAVGTDAVMTGYRDPKGLSVSVLDLSAAPRLADTVVLDNRYESEGRSHAFNSAVEADGHGLMGLPTVLRKDDAGRWWWNSDSSDVSFLSLTADRRLASIGELKADENAKDASYDCEVSCVDWYGNTRPIFTGGRVFGLTGTELVEGRVDNGRIGEIRRLNLSRPVGK